MNTTKQTLVITPFENDIHSLQLSSAGKSPVVKPSIARLVACRCPRCREGKMFKQSNPWNLKKVLDMEDACSVCKQPFNLEIGFYYGSSYVSYALSVFFAALYFVAWFFTIGIGLDDNRFYSWLISNTVLLIALQPWLMRVARTGWLAFFVSYDPNWRTNDPQQPERTNPDQENNW